MKDFVFVIKRLLILFLLILFAISPIILTVITKESAWILVLIVTLSFTDAIAGWLSENY
jgi:hypothetical protein